MEGCSNFIRVRVDLSEISIPFIKQAWVSVDRAILRTVKDFKHTLYRKFKLPEDRNTSLYLKSYLLLDDETIFILRDEDLIRVVYEDSSSLLNRQCGNVIDFTSNSAKGSVKCLVDGNCDGSFPVAKKPKTHSPVPVTKSLEDMWALSETSLQNNSCSAGSRSIPTKINTDICQNKAELGGKKHKKHKKCVKVKTEYNSVENFLQQKTSGYGANHVYRSDELHCSLLCGENVQKQEDETSSAIKVTNSKQCKVKEEKYPRENTVQSLDRICTFGAFVNNSGCVDAGANKHGNFVLCREDTQDDRIKTGSTCEMVISKKHKVNEGKLSSKNIIELEERGYDPYAALENHVDVQKDVKCNGASDLRNLQVSQITNEIFSPTETKDVVVKHSSLQEVNVQKQDGKSDGGSNSKDLHINENANEISCGKGFKPTDWLFSSLEVSCDQLPYSINNSPIQVEGDCTQSLGNNCPKKKRKRRGKKVSCNRAVVPFDSTTNSSIAVSPGSIGKPISDLIHVKNKQHARKHIRFINSPERSPTVEALDSKCSGDIKGKGVPTIIDTSQSAQISLKLKSAACGADTSNEKCALNVSVHQTCDEHQTSAQSNGTFNQNKTVAPKRKDSPLQVDGQKSYSAFPPLNKFPSVGDVIAFKMLELTNLYCPEVSDYKEGEIVHIDTSTDTLEINLREEQVIVRTGKFENLYPNEEPKPQVIKKVCVLWSTLIEPKLVVSLREYDPM